MTTFTNSEIRAAILKTAGHIEKYPDEFDFDAVCAPTDTHCGFPGCALGWIGYFGKVPVSTCKTKKGNNYFGGVDAFLGHRSDTGFYDAMTAICQGWTINPYICARTLRAYADKYHPADKPVSGELPDAIKRIFAGEVLA